MKRLFLFAFLAVIAAGFLAPVFSQDVIRVDIPGLAEGAIPLEFVKIPAGSFTMGTPKNADERWPEEFPPHEVTLSRDFYLCRYETTQAQWKAVLGGEPSRYDYSLASNHPVEGVSHRDIIKFFDKLREMGVGDFRLPTEAEWEYACHAGTTTPYIWGETHEGIDDYAWYYYNSKGRHHTVGTKLPNAWGLYDMTGNLFEWTADKWRDGYDRGPVTDPIEDRDTRYYVIKGGGYKHNEHRTRPAWRYRAIDTRRDESYGFRIAADVSNVSSTQTSVDDWRIR
ncbi:MAG: SUMF1/EgtB/PvdO family nonheme iron enzyme [bacterium]|nr:SUMF1/EgtB/PvdO family nonheme iron enzyme [bacterium]